MHRRPGGGDKSFLSREQKAFAARCKGFFIWREEVKAYLPQAIGSEEKGGRPLISVRAFTH